MPLFPAFLDLGGKTCLVVGSGKVGRRKMRALLDAGARIRMVTLEPAPTNSSSGVEWLCEPFAYAHLEGVCLAFGAATPEVNREVVAGAMGRGIWVNSASDPGSGNMIVPATAFKGPIQLAIGTGGASPAIAAHLRDFLANQVDDAMLAWVELLASMRKEIQRSLPDSQRPPLLRELAEPRWLERLRERGREQTETEMRAVVDAFLNR